jgi:hypothetical protein
MWHATPSSCRPGRGGGADDVGMDGVYPQIVVIDSDATSGSSPGSEQTVALTERFPRIVRSRRCGSADLVVRCHATVRQHSGSRGAVEVGWRRSGSALLAGQADRPRWDGEGYRAFDTVKQRTAALQGKRGRWAGAGYMGMVACCGQSPPPRSASPVSHFGTGVHRRRQPVSR